MYGPYLSVHELIVTEVLGVGCDSQSWGTGGRRGSGTLPFGKALVNSYSPSTVTFPLSLRVLEICRFCAPTRHFYPTHQPFLNRFTPNLTQR